MLGRERAGWACKGHPGRAGWPAYLTRHRKPLDKGTSSGEQPGRAAVLCPWVTVGDWGAKSGLAIKVRRGEQVCQATLPPAVMGGRAV